MARKSKVKLQKPLKKTVWDNGRALISLRKTIEDVTAEMSDATLLSRSRNSNRSPKKRP